MDTQEILPESIEEQSNAGLTEIEAAMDKISELENTDAPEQNLEENSENKTKDINLESSDAKENPTTEVAGTQVENIEECMIK